MSIKLKLIILTLCIGLLPTLVVGLIAYSTISTQLTSKTTIQLDSVATKQQQKIQGILQKKKEEVVKLANRYDLKSELGQYLAVQSLAKREAVTTLIRDKKIENPDIQIVRIADRAGRVIVSSERAGDKAFITPVGDSAKLQSQQVGVAFAVQSNAEGVDRLVMSTSIVVDAQTNLVLDVVFRVDDVLAAVQDYTGLGATGETLVVIRSDENRYISLFPLRFDTGAALKRDLTQTFDTGKTQIDYRGRAIVKSVKTIPVTGWLVAAKLDGDEAYAPIRQLGNTLLIIILTSSLIIILIALYVTRFFTAPLIALTKKAQSIMLGDYTQHIAVNSSDEVGTLATAFNDMTEGLESSTRKLGEEHARLQASINSLDIGFLMTTKDGKVASSNPAILEILGLNTSKRRLRGSAMALTLGDLQKQLSNFDFIGAIKTCLAEAKPFAATEVSYGTRFLSILGAPIRLDHGEVIGSVMIVEDITEAKVLARSRDEFFSIASHELRTPLTAIRGNTRMILDYYAELLKDPSVKEMLTDIHGSSVRLIDIVNDFLDVSRIEQGKITFNSEAVFIEKAIESVIYEMRPILNEKQIYLKSDTMTLKNLPQVWADADRIKQVIYNLVGNAAKFTEKGGITIAATVEHDRIKINIADTGRGIPLDKQELLFRKFQQAGNSLLTRDTTRGTGLGLYISKMLIERMGGTIRLEKSEEGKGTTFTFTLPIAGKDQKMDKPR